MNYDELNRIWGDDFHEGAEEIDDIDGCYHLLLDPKQLRISGDFVYELSADGGAVSSETTTIIRQASRSRTFWTGTAS